MIINKALDYQTAFWKAWQTKPDTENLVLTYGFSYSSECCPDKLFKALNAFVHQNRKQLNIHFYNDDKGICHEIYAPEPVNNILVIDIKDTNDSSATILQQHLQTQFDLSIGPLYHFVIIKLDSGEILLGCSFSHIIFDGQSYDVFRASIESLYHSPLNHEPVSLSIENKAKMTNLIEDISFWRNYCTKVKTNHAHLPFQHEVARHQVTTQTISIKGKKLSQILTLLRQSEITLFQFIVAVTSGLLKVINKSDDDANLYLLNHTVDTRDTKSTIGCYTNINPLVIEFEDSLTIEQLFVQIKLSRRQTKQHQNLPYYEICQCNNDIADVLSTTPVLVNESNGLINFAPPNLTDTPTDIIISPSCSGPNQLTVTYAKSSDVLTIKLSLALGHNKVESSSELKNLFLNLINFYCDDTAKRLSDFPYKPTIPKVDSDNSACERTLESLITYNDHFKNKIAIHFGGDTINYISLFAQAQALVCSIESLHSNTEQFGIGIYLNRSHHLCVSLLAVLISGNYYVPLNTKYPEALTAHMLREASVELVISDVTTIASYPVDFPPERLLLCDRLHNVRPNTNTSPFDNEFVLSTPKVASGRDSDLAYIIFTSGSTGKPKGVKITRSNLSNFVYAMQKSELITENDCIFALTTLCFDISLLELLVPLTLGATIRIAPDNTHNISQLLIKELENEITVLQATPSTLQLLINSNWSPIKPMKILMGGELSSSSVIDALLSKGHCLYNMYGPTEATIWSSYSRLYNSRSISIGSPITGMTYYVLSRDFKPVSFGCVGELAISGNGIFAGYTQSDISNSIVKLEDGTPVYLTGDQVIYHGDNEIHYIGRKDSQVKMRGLRIDLNQIESFIRQIVTFPIACVKREQPEPHLCCFIECRRGEDISASIREKLREQLPNYMVPQSFISVTQLPLSKNNKIDRKKLSTAPYLELHIQSEHLYTDNIKVRKDINNNEDETLQQLTLLIMKNFNLSQVDPDRPLGHVGFNSLSFNKLAELIHKQYKVNISPHQFYQYDTLLKIVHYISDSIKSDADDKQTLSPRSQRPTNRPNVAITGIAVKVPGSSSLNKFWQTLTRDSDCIFRTDRHYLHTKFEAGYLESVDEFDALFFNISPLEAESIDPQQRLLLETAWHTIQNAGYTKQFLDSKKVGVYIASTAEEYSRLAADNSSSPYSLSGTSRAILANRISYFFNWHGPSLVIDTACSSSLVALKRACQDIQDGAIEYAFVGASNLILSDDMYRALDAGNFLSDNYRCATFDESADGYARGEGIVGLFLQNEQVTSKRTNIYAYILKCVENHVGQANSLTSPSVNAQVSLLENAYRDDDIYNKLSYIETHGTGTRLGDPIEFDAIREFCRKRSNKSPIYLGCLKAKIGHLEAAAGLASVVKVLLAMHHNIIPGNHHINQYNSLLSMSDTTIQISKQDVKWKDEDKFAGVSSFGFGGSNAHVVLRSCNMQKRILSARQNYVFCISANTIFSLKQYLSKLQTFLHSQIDTIELVNVEYTLNACRDHFNYRIVLQASNVTDLIQSLDSYQDKDIFDITLGSADATVQISSDRTTLTAYEIEHLYLTGHDINWHTYYDGIVAVVTPLPEYVFERSKYWHTNTTGLHQNKDEDILKMNKSALNASLFTLPVTHYWFTHHVVKNKCILPGVAHLDLVLSALQRFDLNITSLCFDEISWIDFIECTGDSVDIEVNIEQIESSYHFTVMSNNKKCSFGILTSTQISSLESSIQPNHDCVYNLEHMSLYEYFERCEIKYGDYFRCLKQVSLYSNATEVATIDISSRKDNLLTNLLDCSFQSIMAFSYRDRTETLMPYSIRRCEITPHYFTGSNTQFKVIAQQHSEFRFSLEIFNQERLLVMKIHDLGVMPMKSLDNSQIPTSALISEETMKLHCFAPFWSQSAEPSLAQFANHPIIVLTTSDSALDGVNIPNIHATIPLSNFQSKLPSLIAQLNIKPELWLVDNDDYDGLNHQSINAKAILFLKLCQYITTAKISALKVIALNAITHADNSVSLMPQNSLLIAIAQTAAKELTQIPIIPISVGSFDDDTVRQVALEQGSDTHNNDPVCIEQRQRFVRQLKEVNLHSRFSSVFNNECQFKQNGHYIILGGLGGIGYTLSAYLIQKYRARLVLVGRGPEDRKKLDLLSTDVGLVTYERIDLAKAGDVNGLIKRYSHTNGIIHSALVLQDRTISNMDEVTLTKVLEPKVQGMINLSNAIVAHNVFPDFILLFSSIQSFISNAGQANYTAACVFKDIMGQFFQNVEMRNVKIINWAYWGSVGIVASKSYRDRMSDLGIGSIEPLEAFPLLENFLKSSLSQIAVLKANKDAIDRLNFVLSPSQDFNDHIAASSSIRSLVPHYNPGEIQHRRHHEMQNALEEYAQSLIANLPLPHSVIPKYHKLIASIQNMPKSSAMDKQQLLMLYPELRQHIHLLEHCLANYDRVLTGNENHMNILFPDGSFELVQPVYRDNPISDYFNDIVAQIVLNQFDSIATDTVRIIEIGAGTGSTTHFVLNKLASTDKSYDYFYTDLSIAFFNKARLEFESFLDHLHFEILDIESAIDTHMIQKFDIVIATNVLHATKNISNTLLNVNNLLKDDGILILNEVTTRQDYATLTFGLTPGWWLFQDDRIPDSPLIDPNTWQRLLNKAGFSEVVSHGPVAQKVFTCLKSNVSKALSPSSQHNQSYSIQPEHSPLAPIDSASDNKGNKSHNQDLDSIRNFVIECISNIMRIPQADITNDVPFKSLGIDSLIVLELLKPFKERYPSEHLPSTILFEYPTVNKLADYLSSISPTDIEENVIMTDPTTNTKKKSREDIEKAEASLLGNLRDQDIAIIGINAKLPNAENITQFWSNLKAGLNCVTEIPDDRWQTNEFYSNGLYEDGKMYTKHGAFVEQIQHFDNEFFGITPYDAMNMDPQERLFLESVYGTLEDSGYTVSELHGKDVGVFVGVMNGAYAWLGIDNTKVNHADSLYWSIANRTSYFFDWHGPSMAIDTACSSSLSALHSACLSIQNDDCEYAIVGGVNLIIHPKQYTKLCRLHMLSHSNECRSFGEGADGFVDGEGIISIIIKKAKHAVRDNDKIYGLIKGTAINSGGHSNGYTAPNPAAQANVIKKALQRSGLSSKDIDYVEAHGTGTELGDPIEIRGLKIALPESTALIGSVKSNIGHLESAAGLAGLVKVLLQMQEGLIVKSLFCENKNHKLHFDDTGLSLANQPFSWHDRQRTAIVSSYGAGGANGNVVLSSWDAKQSEITLSSYIIPVSAKSLLSLICQLTEDYHWLMSHSDCDLYSFAYMKACAREHYRERVVFIVDSFEQLYSAISSMINQLLNDTSIASNIETSRIIHNVRNNNTYHNINNQPIEVVMRTAKKYINQGKIDWNQFYQQRSVSVITTYPFKKVWHWLEDPRYGAADSDRFITHHSIAGQAIAPASLSLALAYNANPDINKFTNLRWVSPITKISHIQVSDSSHSIYLKSLLGEIQFKCDTNSVGPALVENPTHIQLDTTLTILNQREIYSFFTKHDYIYGSSYKLLRFALISQTSVFGLINTDRKTPYRLNHCLLDAGLQLAILLPNFCERLGSNEIAIPHTAEIMTLDHVKIDDISFCYCCLSTTQTEQSDLSVDLCYYDSSLQPCLLIKGLVSKIINKTDLLLSDASTITHARRPCHQSPDAHFPDIKVHTIN